jgi:hypothetical protein
MNSPDGMLTVSHSELATWTRCPRRWFLGTYLGWGYDPENAPPAGNSQLGTRIHLALEASEGHRLDALQVLSYVYDTAVAEHPYSEAELRKEADMAFAMVEGFLQWAEEEGYNAGYGIVSTERETSIVLPFTEQDGEFRLIAKLDVVVSRLEDGSVLFRDYKTVADFSKANRLPRDTQMKTYSLIQAMQAKEDPSLPRVSGGQYVMLRRIKRTAKARPPFYKTEEFLYNRHDLNSTWLRVRKLATEISDARSALLLGADHRETARYVPGDDCDWYCPFRDVCPMLDDGSRWEDALTGSFMQVDPYARYRDTAMDRILEHFQPGRKEQDGSQEVQR